MIRTPRGRPTEEERAIEHILGDLEGSAACGVGEERLAWEMANPAPRTMYAGREVGEVKGLKK
jgi:hypothetical protein